MNLHKDIECTSQEGITIGLIDSIMSVACVLKTRNLDETRSIQDALIDLSTSKALKELIELGRDLSFSNSMEIVGD